jgi:cysteinyl-tRNA synthetase
MKERDRFRQAGEWQKADGIRKEIESTGSMVKDKS